jgi:hypothetical protein
MRLAKYSFGIGDRFGHEGAAQLRALIDAKQDGIDIIPVWNKSYREHHIIGSKPSAAKQEADNAVAKLQWQDNYYVDADHVNSKTVAKFITSANFFTLDVADKIGVKASDELINAFVEFNQKYIGSLMIPGIASPFQVTSKVLTEVANKFLAAICEAQKIYQLIVKEKGSNDFVTEISMDEVASPQSPLELFFILSAIAYFEIPAQTIAPRFSGRFNKGVDYVGDLKKFEREFADDLAVIDFAIREFNLPDNLKLSIHSGSDKFSIYPIINKLIKQHDAGIHVKTAGTTWLEELIGLALAGNEALQLVKDIYAKAYQRKEELCAPYAEVIDIDSGKLPDPSVVQNWNSQKFANTLRHIPDCPDYNPNFRQLLHVGYKIAAEYGTTFTNLLEKYSDIIGREVTANLYERHIKRLFGVKS